VSLVLAMNQTERTKQAGRTTNKTNENAIANPPIRTRRMTGLVEKALASKTNLARADKTRTALGDLSNKTSAPVCLTITVLIA